DHLARDAPRQVGAEEQRRIPHLGRLGVARQRRSLAHDRKHLGEPGDPRAARVLIGPEEMPLTRMFLLPRSCARYRTLASRAALATPMMLYPGTTFSEPR